MNTPWHAGRRIAVLGGTGFIGSHVVERLLGQGAEVRVVTRSKAHAEKFLAHVGARIEVVAADCSDLVQATRALRSCDGVIHLAGTVAGISLNRTRPALMFARNASLVVPILDACVSNAVERLVVTSSACVYARDVTIPTPEDEGFQGDPEVTNLGYGWAKRMAEVACRLYALEYGLRTSVLRPYNAYGPRDDFAVGTSHVIPSLVRRLETEDGDLVVWGSGAQTRSFIYVEDVAEATLRALECVPGPEPMNVGSEEEISIGELARLIAELAGSRKRVVFDTTKPDGQRRRQPRLERAKELLGFEATTTLRDGLTKTIQDFRAFGRDRVLADGELV